MSEDARGSVGQAYSLTLRPGLPLPVDLPPATGAENPTLIRVGRPSREPGSVVIWRARIDGRAVIVERSPNDVVRLRFGEDAEFRIDPAAATISCSPPPDDDVLRWQRFLLDTVLWTAALVQGRVALHAAAVADEAGAVAILGGTGSGKTSLALAMLRRGHALVADDIVVVSLERGGVLAHPAPPVMNVDVSARARVAPGLGKTLGTLGDEEWVAVDDAAQRPVRLRAIAVLSRFDEAHHVRQLGERESFFTLDANALWLPELPLTNAQTRFLTLAEVAVRVPVVDLHVPRSLPPEEVAEALVESLPTEPTEPDRAAPPQLQRVRVP